MIASLTGKVFRRAYLSAILAASIAAGSVMPCCINKAARPATCGVDIDVPT